MPVVIFLCSVLLLNKCGTLTSAVYIILKNKQNKQNKINKSTYPPSWFFSWKGKQKQFFLGLMLPVIMHFTSNLCRIWFVFLALKFPDPIMPSISVYIVLFIVLYDSIVAIKIAQLALVWGLLKVYDPITFGFIHWNGVFGIRWKPLFYSLPL